MIATAEMIDSQRCTLTRYTMAWSVGTGLQVSLVPGEYRITGYDDVSGQRYLYLNETYHCRADLCDCGEEETSN